MNEVFVPWWLPIMNAAMILLFGAVLIFLTLQLRALKRSLPMIPVLADSSAMQKPIENRWLQIDQHVLTLRQEVQTYRGEIRSFQRTNVEVENARLEQLHTAVSDVARCVRQANYCVKAVDELRQRFEGHPCFNGGGCVHRAESGEEPGGVKA